MKDRMLNIINSKVDNKGENRKYKDGKFKHKYSAIHRI